MLRNLGSALDLDTLRTTDQSPLGKKPIRHRLLEKLAHLGRERVPIKGDLEGKTADGERVGQNSGEMRQKHRDLGEEYKVF